MLTAEHLQRQSLYFVNVVLCHLAQAPKLSTKFMVLHNYMPASRLTPAKIIQLQCGSHLCYDVKYTAAPPPQPYQAHAASARVHWANEFTGSITTKQHCGLDTSGHNNQTEHFL